MSNTRVITIETRLIRAHVYAALGGLVLSAIFGLLVSVKFHAPQFLGHDAMLTWGRLRYDHTQGILYSWLGNAFLAFLYYAVPYLAQRPVTGARVGWSLFLLWNVGGVLGGWSLVLAGKGQPLEWAEFPLGIAAVIEIGLLLTIVQFALPLLRGKASGIYVSGWYVLGAATFTALAYPVGNLVPQLLPGAMGAAFSGLWIHDAVGLFVTPFALAIAYFVIPAVTRRPIYSHFYSMIGFWLLFLAYPLNGIHHYLYSALPMTAQHAAVVASLYQGLDVILVVSNLLLSIPMAVAALALEDIGLRFVWTSVVLYLVVSVQGSLQAVMSLNRFVHFSDWVIGHSHLAMIGFASFAAMGAVVHIWQHVPNARFNRRAAAWSYWLLMTGLALMVVDLTAAGLVQGTLWQGPAQWIESVRASQPYWLFRSVDGLFLLGGFVCFGAGLVTGKKVAPKMSQVGSESGGPESSSGIPRWLDTTYAATFAAGLVFFVISFAALGVLPAMHLREEILRTTPPGARLGLSAAERHGREIYARNGCAYCHTQQVRDTAADIRRFGPPTEAWETQGDLPQMWGTRRIGPDLARESGRRRADWQLVHLYNPEGVVPDSVMPTYDWMFEGAPDRPTADALDLVAYLDTLGRAAAPKTARGTPAAMPLPGPLVGDLARGRRVFADNCSGCHGLTGNGERAAGRALRPPAFDLAGARLSEALIWRAVQEGIAGSSMPEWHSLEFDDLRAVAAYAASLGNSGAPPTSGYYAPEPVLREAGRRVFATHCVSCHGERGDGAGPDAAKYTPRPANFQEMQPSYATAARAIRDGVPGTEMKSWPLLTPAEVQAVTYYIRTFYVEAQR